jgi:hypothetical protein
VSLVLVGWLMVGPPVPFYQVQETRYPWYQTSSPTFQMLIFAAISVQVRCFHRVPKPWNWLPIKYIRPQVRHIWHIRFIRAESGSGTMTVWLGQTYLTSWICLVPVRFQNRGTQSQVDRSNLRSDISHPPNFSSLHQVPKALHPLADISEICGGYK